MNIFNDISGHQFNISATDPIQSLPQADGASFDPLRICLTDTRVKLLEDVWSWIDSIDASEAERVLWITGVAGAGKSAIAHTIAKQCHDSPRHIGSSFFFDQNTDGRNNPKKLFSTIARDLASFSPDISLQVRTALESDPRLASAPISRQFEGLLCGWKCNVEEPVVIVIDALDEGWSTDLLHILRDGTQKLHKKFRIIITSRPVHIINLYLSNTTHIQRKTIDIREKGNLDDIALYSHHRLKRVAQITNIEGWPDEKLVNAFLGKAEGLFIWVSVVTSFLETTVSPAKKLEKLLSERDPSVLNPEVKMAKLYSVVLEACDLTDEDFIDGYTCFMGAVIAVKEAVSLRVLESLHRNETDQRAGEILSRVASLLSGFDLDSQEQPIRPLHLSLQEFLTSRDRCTPGFYLDLEDNNERLAILCQTVLIQDLDKCVSDVTKHPALWYACRFWIDHTIKVVSPQPKLINALREFLETKVKLWAKLMLSQRAFRKLNDVRVWIQRVFPEGHELNDNFNIRLAIRLAFILDDLSENLYKENCYEKAVEAAEDSVEIYQSLSDPRSRFRHTWVLIRLAQYRPRLGRYAESLEAADEAVELCRSLLETEWGSKNEHKIEERCARSLTSRAKSLDHLGRFEEALESNKDAERIYRALAIQPHTIGKRLMAYSLCQQAQCLRHLGHGEEALSLLRKSESCYRELNLHCSFNRANCLRDMSRCLIHLKRPEDALEAADESVSICWKLQGEYPVGFDWGHFSATLTVRAYCLTLLNRHDEALQKMREVVELRRELDNKINLASTGLDLGISLCHLADCLHNSDSRDEAAMCVAEAEEIRRRLGFEGQTPIDARSHVATALTTLDRLLEEYKSRIDNGACQESSLSASREV